MGGEEKETASQELEPAHVAAEDVEVEKKAEDEAPVPIAPLSSLWMHADTTDQVLLVVAVLGSVAGGVIMPMFSVIFGALVDELGPTSTIASLSSAVNDLTFYFLLLGLGSFVVSYMEVAALLVTAERQVRRLREHYVQAILRQEVGWFDTTSPGEVATRVTQDTMAVQDAIGEKLGAGIRFYTQCITGFIIGFVKGWELTLVLMAVAPFLAVAGAFITKLMQELQSSEQTAYASAGSVADEILRSIRTVLAFGAQEKSARRYAKELKAAEDVGIRKNFIQGVGLGVTMFLMFLAYGLAFYVGALLIAADREETMDTYVAAGCPRMDQFTCAAAEGACVGTCATVIVPCAVGDTCKSGGDVLTVFFAVLIGAMSLGQAAPSVNALSKGRGAIGKVLSVLQRKPTIDVASDKGEKLAAVKGHLRLEGVRFAYPSRPDVTVFQDFSIDVEPGSTVALVGASGSGKSSTVQLLERYYDPLEGRVTLDGTDIRDLNLAWYRQQLGLVEQEPTLFDVSILDNIRYGKQDASREEVEAAAKAANAHDFISALPEGYDTRVGSAGFALSGGQKQRVAIARAIVRDPAVLLLDEATSALDSESEKVVQAALDELLAAKRRTTVVIAHRLSTIQGADKIVVVHEGRVVEQGTHSELLRVDNGVYRQFVEMQAGLPAGAEADADGSEAPVDAVEGIGRVMRARSASNGSDSMPGPMLPEEREEQGKDGRRTSSTAGARRTSSTAGGRDRARSRAMSSNPAELVAGKAEGKGTEEEKEEDEKERQQLYKVPLSRIIALNRPEAGYFAVALVSAVLNGSLMPFWAVAFSRMLDIFYEPDVDKMRSDGLTWGLGFAALAVAGFLANLGQLYGFGVMGERLTSRLRNMTFRRMLRQEVAWFDEPANAPGALTTRLATDASLVHNAAGERLGLTMQNFMTLLAGLIIAFVSGWQLALVVLACFPFIAISGAIQMQSMAGFATEGTKAVEGAGAVLSEGVSGIRTVVAFGMEDRVHAMYSDKLAAPQQMGFRRAHVGGAGFGFSNMVVLLAYALSFWAGSKFIEDGLMTFEEMMRVLMGIMGAAMGVGQSAQLTGDAAKAKVAVSRIFRLLDRQSRIDPASEEGSKPGSMQGKLAMRDLKFTYPTRPDAQVFQNFSLDVDAGSTVALVGASGSGKSTVVSLLERFYDAGSGSLEVDGEPITALNVAWLRQQLGLVEQEPTLFDTTVIENIRYGKQDASREEVEAAAKAANAHDFITALPEGYGTRVGQGGNRLSGGQKQRVAIARAIVRDPAVLLLDEATSALDSESEKVVQAALDELLAAKRRTTVVIAHRLSTIQGADKIVVVHEGRVVEQGTHSELLAKESHYHALWTRQAMQEE